MERRGRTTRTATPTWRMRRWRCGTTPYGRARRRRPEGAAPRRVEGAEPGQVERHRRLHREVRRGGGGRDDGRGGHLRLGGRGRGAPGGHAAIGPDEEEEEEERRRIVDRHRGRGREQVGFEARGARTETAAEAVQGRAATERGGCHVPRVRVQDARGGRGAQEAQGRRGVVEKEEEGGAGGERREEEEGEGREAGCEGGEEEREGVQGDGGAEGGGRRVCRGRRRWERRRK